SVPTQVAVLQEKVKKQIEGATKFKVQSVNVQVVTVNVAQ
ncbi:MAG TPA: Asp23/Gls24 family envelope stress response protein, partial [Clostridiales bacterium]|nr:Asp23/Gls24 family envelope stress response protein [Clostridiales bacterium]